MLQSLALLVWNDFGSFASGNLGSGGAYSCHRLRAKTKGPLEHEQRAAQG